LILQNLMSGSFVILLGAFVSFSFAKTICDPIINLTKAAKVIADGDLAHRVTANTKDEVGELARTFNDMAVKLKKSHTNLEEKVGELAAEKELLSITLSGMSEGLIAVDVNKQIILFNTVAENLCGWEFKEVEGKLVDDIFQIINEQTKEPVENPIAKALQSGETECGSESDALLSRDGRECPVYTSAAPIRKNEGAVIGVVMVFRDVSYEREIDRMKTDFVSSVSHELRTPLTSIKAYTDTILRDSNMPEETKSQFLVVALIEDLLEVSRIASGTAKIEREFVNIETVIEKVLTALKPLAEKKNIQLETNIPDKLPQLQADESKIESVVINLVNNAIKFTPENGRVSDAQRSASKNI
ncbi:MAG: PAS domain S-box protein, partial [Planctomycetota bacterium]